LSFRWGEDSGGGSGDWGGQVLMVGCLDESGGSTVESTDLSIRDIRTLSQRHLIEISIKWMG
jgi:hypothetical protein